MKKISIILLLLMVLEIPAYSLNKRMEPASPKEGDLPNIFIYAIPEDNNNQNTNNQSNDEEVYLDINDDTTISATTLKGYAQYIEDSEAVYLKDESNNFVLNIKVPQKISTSEGLNLSSIARSKQISRFKNTEYNIAPKSINESGSKGNFTFGALYGDEVDNIAMLESEAGLFTKYEKNRFALSSTYKKNLNTTYNQFYDTISIAPEFKFNNYMSIKNEYKADITRNRKSGSLIFSINPFGKKDTDRLRLELGAKQTIYADNTEPKTEFSFSTKLKL